MRSKYTEEIVDEIVRDSENAHFVVQPEIKPLPALAVVDIPDEALFGRLGELAKDISEKYHLPLSFVYPALITAATQATGPSVRIRNNLYTVLIADSGRGKGTAMRLALTLMGLGKFREDGTFQLTSEGVYKNKAGSVETFVRNVNSPGFGKPFLIYQEEIGNLFSKADIDGSNWHMGLEELYDQDEYAIEPTNKHPEPATFRGKLSLLGGTTPARRKVLLNEHATSGNMRRMLWYYRPDNAPKFTPRDFEESPLTLGKVRVEVTQDARQAMFEHLHELGDGDHVAEPILRATAVAASVSGKEKITANDLREAFVLADHQILMRQLCPINSGKGLGVIRNAILEYLRMHAPKGDWVELRGIIMARDLYGEGASIIAAVRDLETMGEITVWWPAPKDSSKGGRPSQTAGVRVALCVIPAKVA